MNPFLKIKQSIVELSQKHEIAEIQKWGGTMAMGFSALAFTGSVLLNKGIPKEQKEFLVSQELADGAINVTLFWVMTGQFKDWAEREIKAGKIFPETVKKEVEKIKSDPSLKDAPWEKIMPLLSKEKVDEISKFHTGFKNAVSLGGSLLAACIITPIVRNIIASTYQKGNNNNNVIDKPKIAQPVQIVTEKPQISSVTKTQTFQSRAGMRI